jgi:hypothetical protein
MPFGIRKLPNKDLYKVFNKETKEVYSKGSTLENAKKQVRLLYSLEDDNIKGDGVNTPIDTDLYEKVKNEANNIYKKNSAYKSGWIVKTYKSLGGRYSGDKPTNQGLDRWYKENWKDIGNKEYPVYRPTKRITKETPLIPDEISKSNLKKQIDLKQRYKGMKNLPPFEKL